MWYENAPAPHMGDFILKRLQIPLLYLNRHIGRTWTRVILFRTVLVRPHLPWLDPEIQQHL